MIEFSHFTGKLLIICGLAVAAAGILLLCSGRIPWLGRLPGDILIEKKNFTFYFPFATSIIVSLLLTILFMLIGRR